MAAEARQEKMGGWWIIHRSKGCYHDNLISVVVGSCWLCWACGVLCVLHAGCLFKDEYQLQFMLFELTVLY